MAGLCTDSVRVSGSGCGHLQLTVNLDGVQKVFSTGISDNNWDAVMTDNDYEQMFRLLARWWKSKGLDIANFSGRVLCGEEATNVKVYNFFGPGLAILKQNIGVTYINILPGLNGEPILVDFTGCTVFRAVLAANFVGTGPFGARIVRNSDNVVLFENANLSQTGERQPDSDWQVIPGAFSGLTLLKAQVKSATASDDPVFRGCVLLVK